MAGAVSGGYFPTYPHHDGLPDPEIRTLITNFYRVSDNPESNELWVSYFTKDAEVTIGNERGVGEEEIRRLRAGMWTAVGARKHTVDKVFPGRFDEGDSRTCELMLFGRVDYRTRDGREATVPWAGHAVLSKVKREDEGEEWKMARYRVWLQR